MPRKVNQAAVEQARNLIKGRQYEADSDWSDSQPSAKTENAFIEKHGYSEYGRWHLAYDSDAAEDTKERYAYPYGDFDKLHRAGLIAAKQRAGKEGDEDIGRACDELLDRLPQNDR
jgi:hypothetical protein